MSKIAWFFLYKNEMIYTLLLLNLLFHLKCNVIFLIEISSFLNVHRRETFSSTCVRVTSIGLPSYYIKLNKISETTGFRNCALYKK